MFTNLDWSHSEKECYENEKCIENISLIVRKDETRASLDTWIWRREQKINNL